MRLGRLRMIVGIGMGVVLAAGPALPAAGLSAPDATASAQATAPTVASAATPVPGARALARFTLPVMPKKKQKVLVELRTRKSGKARYSARITITKRGTARMQYLRRSVKGKTRKVGKSRIVARGISAGTPYRVEFSTVDGTRRVLLSSRVWREGSPVPSSWFTRTDKNRWRITKGGTVQVLSRSTKRAKRAQVALLTRAPAASQPAPPPTTITPPRSSTTRVVGSKGTPTSVPALNLPVSSLGGVLPSTRALTSAAKVFVAPSGSDSNPGTISRPVKTLRRALEMSIAGGQVVLRGGTYPVSENSGSIYRDKQGVTVTNYPGEVPVLDGTVPLTGTPRTERTGVVSLPYRQVPAGLGEGVNLNWLPAATFNSAGDPTGLARDRGWECVASDGRTHTRPAPTASDPDGCAAGTRARVITGYYPDQAWAGDRKLTQVLNPALVRPGYFYVVRGPDTQETATRLHLSTQDAQASPLRVSAPASTSFVQVDAKDVTLNGLHIRGFSASWDKYPLHVYKTGHNLRVRDVRITDASGVAVKVAGWRTPGGADILTNMALSRTRIEDPGWKGLAAIYVTGLALDSVQISGSNHAGEFAYNSALHVTHTHRTTVRRSVIRDTVGVGAWVDQSSYDSRFVANRLEANSSHQLFYEFSHAATLVGNLLVGGSTDAALRLSGASDTKLVNNTIVGGRDSIWVYVDSRAKKYYDTVHKQNRWCAEHRVRYGESGDAAADCNVTFTADFDTARLGAYAATNLTPGLNWRVSITTMVNNVMGPASAAGHCVVNVPVCITGYTEYDNKPNQIPMNEIIPSSAVWNGNVYQTSGQLLQLWGGPNLPGFIQPKSVLAVQQGLGGSYYRLSNPESHAQSGTGWTNGSGVPNRLLTDKHGWAAPSPNQARITAWLPAGSRHYGAFWG